MCGIVGYVGHRPVQDLLVEGLRKLEYRGYDSAGVSLLAGGQIESVRAVGNLDNLDRALAEREAEGGVATATAEATTGIAHTRWATHGRVNEENAHPHFDSDDAVHVVVNGIVENYLALKHRLIDMGAVFTSETDAEVIAHLIAHHMATGDLVEAVRRAYLELEGHFAFVAMQRDQPELLAGARKECPLIVGVGDGERFLASAVPAFLPHTRRVQYVENGEIVAIRRDETILMTPQGEVLEREVVELDWDEATAEKGGYETFMLKEIHEQADAVAETIADRTVRESGVDFGAELDEAILRDAARILIVACGTSYHSGVFARYAIQNWARVPVGVDIASEFRYADPLVGPGDVVIGMTQSGETADTLAAMRVAREKGATVLAVTNVMGSQATRDADATIFTRAGQEVSVAATKTFTCQVAVMLLIALRIAELKGTLEAGRLAELVQEVKRLPRLITELIEALDASGA
ncbi:MAG TPA: glutamine--fructose-6-phosphate transaminase (isomerizing), partial [Solirubrobacteraceae bacterium]|nr:glutamine--fructose-6-phosphate transaminase (isomerizing) [Solirubrobacteraceae bacterium]